MAKAYSVTLDLPAGDVEYKYMVDNWAGQEDLVDDMQRCFVCSCDRLQHLRRQRQVRRTMIHTVRASHVHNSSSSKR